MLRTASRAMAFAILLGALSLGAPNAMAGTDRQAPRDRPREKNEPLPGVNIRVEGQRLGAMTDDKGEYVILGIPAGQYLIHANMLGYAAYTAENVTITPDFTTELDVKMKDGAWQMQEVRVEAQRPLLQKDATSTTRFISGSDIAKLPVRATRTAASRRGS